MLMFFFWISSSPPPRGFHCISMHVSTMCCVCVDPFLLNVLTKRGHMNRGREREREREGFGLVLGVLHNAVGRSRNDLPGCPQTMPSSWTTLQVRRA